MTGPATGVGFRLATRGSALARAQAELAAEALRAAGEGEVSFLVVQTTGDRDADRPLEGLPGQGWFTTELAAAVIEGRADAAVHSAKDLPTAETDGLELAAVLARGDARDGVVTRDGRGLEQLGEGATVGTSSARRAAILQALHPHLRTLPIRGNVDTRLRKLDAGEFDALVLACSGLDRLGLAARLSERLDPALFVPAPAQGAIALQAWAGSVAAQRCACVDDPATRTAMDAERAVLAALGGGCLLPLGAYATVSASGMELIAALAVAGGLRRARLSGSAGDPAGLGRRVAGLLQ